MANPKVSVVDLPDVMPWLKHHKETSKAWRAFKAFLDMGPGRTVNVAYRQVSGREHAENAPSWWRVWVKSYRWFERADAYDRWTAMCDAEDERKERRLARRQRRDATKAVIGTGLLALKRVREQLEENDVSSVSLGSAAHAITTAVQEMRKDWDEEPVQRVEQIGPSVSMSLTVEDLDKLDAKSLGNLYKRFDED